MTEIQKMPPWSGPGGRAETGPMQFGEDWPGVFIRGDNALWFAQTIRAAIHHLPEELWLLKASLKGLQSDLASCSVGNTGWPPESGTPGEPTQQETK